jgi:hypothetical protein
MMQNRKYSRNGFSRPLTERTIAYPLADVQNAGIIANKFL